MNEHRYTTRISCALAAIVFGLLPGRGEAASAQQPEVRGAATDSVIANSSPGTVEAFAVNLKFAPATAPVVAEPVEGPGDSAKAIVKQSFALTANALSPFAVTLAWDAVANATGYTVLRDGVAIAQLAGSVRNYQDESLTPGSRRRYQVQATLARPQLKIYQPTAPEIPSTSVVEVETPAVLPPSGIVAKVVGPSSIEVSWRLRPGAAGYALLKDGTSISIGPQPQPGVYALNNIAPGASRYALRTIYRKPDGSEVLSEPSSTVSLRTGPFHVLAIGDSIMWGQGLRDESKFKTKVGQWIAAQLGRQVDVTLLARSGAELTPAAQAQGQNAPAYFAHGEVPDSRPSIRDQGLTLGPQRVPSPRDVDLILVDGCINDVSIRTLLDPRIEASQVYARTVGACGTPMLSLLLELARTYENSKIIVTGYYPIVSAYSDLTALTALATHTGALAGSLSPAAAALVGIPIDPVTAAIIGAVAGAIASDQYKRHCIANSDTFAIISTNELLTAAVRANNTYPGNRIEFVPAPFGPTNAYAAGPNTFLWIVPIAPIVQDEVYAERFEACRVVPAGVGNVLCVEASMGHPNVRGAQAYADAITGRLGKFLPEWRARFAPVQMAQ